MRTEVQKDPEPRVGTLLSNGSLAKRPPNNGPAYRPPVKCPSPLGHKGLAEKGN